MKSVIKWLQSITQTTQSTESPETTQSSLYVCQSCDSAYIATEKQTCSTCDGPVEQVPATLDET